MRGCLFVMLAGLAVVAGAAWWLQLTGDRVRGADLELTGTLDPEVLLGG